RGSETAGSETVVPPEGLEALVFGGAAVFETLHAAALRPELAALDLYTWSDRECCLPIGATTATLRRELPDGGALLSDDGVAALPGSFLLFEEVRGPLTGEVADADPAHRQVVRVLTASAGTDLLDGTPIVEIAWHPADALTFALCVSARTDDEHGAVYVDGVSLARGNMVLADHGLTVEGEDLGSVGEEPERYAPTLAGGPLTHAAPLPDRFRPVGPEAVAELPPLDDAAARHLLPAPASGVAAFAAADAAPAVRLESGGLGWEARRDLLASQRFDRHFVAEMDDDGRAHLRFGDDLHGLRPDGDASFTARYRVGNGPAGNLGPGALALAVAEPALPLAAVKGLSNPLPATGGKAAEKTEEVRRYAPQAFRVQQRAVTEADYAEVAARHPEVERATATFRWTGSWHTVFVTVDRRGGQPVDAVFEAELRRHLELYRLAGHDLEIDAPRFVPLHLEIHVCLDDGHRRSDVHRELLRVLSAAELPGGRRGFFHPDLWSFGQPLRRSRLVATAAAVPGVASVEVQRFSRWRQEERPEEVADGVMSFGRLEIARLDNDPSVQENGLLEIALGGGL
ncbi:MAG TPA: putative baseplate assembly protein, partial [Thermoanaerobaculia bacterium]|nr:putative baseplate assembly protein [Thermoanaerobaculia bacterium]